MQGRFMRWTAAVASRGVIAVLLGTSICWAGVAPAGAHVRALHRPHGRGSAHAAVVGGTVLTTDAQAPWTAYLEVVVGNQGWSCDGAILDATHVVTAAHCLFDDTGAAAPAADFYVYTGLANVGPNIAAVAPPAGYDSVAVATADPSYVPSAAATTQGSDPYDVAVLRLSTPLVLQSGSPVQAIALGGATAGPGGGSPVFTSGFGLQTPAPTSSSSPDGTLDALTLATVPDGECVPTTDALVGCASAAAGATCEGDSGSAITSGSPPVLIGVVDAGSSDQNQNFCEPGASTLYAKLTAPELGQFVSGSPGPYPLAPQGGSDIGCQVPQAPQAGETIICTPGTWTNNPQITSEFVDQDTGAVLRTGYATFPLTAAQVGHRIYYRAIAATAGGTAISRTVATAAIGPPPVVVTTTSTTTRSSTPSTPGGSTTTTTTTTTTSTLTGAAHPKARPGVRLRAGVARVRPGHRFALALALSSGTLTLSRAHLCAVVPAGTSVARARGGQVTGRQACWTLSLRAGATRTLSLSVLVDAGHRPGTLTLAASARASQGSVAASVHVTVG